jgi:hypothetical protein
MKTIQLNEEQYKVLQEVLLEQGFKLCEETKAEIEKWQPKGGDWYVTPNGINQGASFVKHKNFGMEYPTREAAEKARDAMRVHNRLLAWLAENDDGWVTDWDNTSQWKYYIRYKNDSKQWEYSSVCSLDVIGALFMSQQNAEKLCKLLNEGVVEL